MNQNEYNSYNLFQLERTLKQHLVSYCNVLQNFVKNSGGKIYPARDTGRRWPIPGLFRGIRDGWQPYGLRCSASPVLTATGFVNGRWQSSIPPHNPDPLTDHQKNYIIVVTRNYSRVAN